MKLNYRVITHEDIDAVTELERSSFSRPWPRSAFEEIVDKEDATYYLAEDVDNGKIVGGLVIFHILDEGDITNVAVAEDYRGQGIATSLMEYALEQGEAEGILDFTLEVRAGNEPAIRVYEKNGFEGVGIRPGFYEEPKEDALVMWRYHEEQE